MFINFILIAVSIFAALSTFVVNNYFNQGPVKSSAILSLIVGLFFFTFPHLGSDYLAIKVPLIFFGASFVGMSSSQTFQHWRETVIAGAIFGFIFINTSQFFTGFGGGLGTTALLSVLMTISLIKIFTVCHCFFTSRGF